MTRRPRAFRLDDPDVVTVAPGEAAERPGSVTITEDPFEAIEAADGTVVPIRERRRAPWVAILLSALGALVALALGLAAEALVSRLFAIAPWLGWLGLGLVAVAVLAFLAIVWREAAGVLRERRIEHIREAAIHAVATKDHEAAKAVTADLVALYRDRPQSARARTRIESLSEEILDADDRLAIAERELMAPLDGQAKRVIADMAKQVSLVTAVSPRAIVDVAFVIFAAVRLLRRVARIYGGRPGTIGFLRLGRAALGHLAVTGGVAVGDSLMHEVLGLGLAARISAKLGEGVLNGLMTARFGLAALAVCRPLPFVAEETPKIGDVAGELITRRLKDAESGAS